MAPEYSLVLPIYNEEAVLPVLLRRLEALMEQLDGPAEVIFVDDGSHDTSPIVLEAKARADARFDLSSFRATSAIRSRSPLAWSAPWATR